MSYILFLNLEDAELYQSSCDNFLGYPEQENQFVAIGSPSHASWELGRAMHFAPIEVNQNNDTWALPKVDGITVPEGATEVAELPSDWYPPAPELGL